MDKILFLPANGFPKRCYQPLIKELETQNTVLALDYWKDFTSDKLTSWWTFIPPIIDAIHQQNEPVILVGHSIGATLAITCALKHKTNIKGVLAIDPAFFLPRHYIPMKILNFMRLIQYVHPMIKASRYKKTFFNTKAEIFNRYRSKQPFAKIRDVHLKELINGSWEPMKQGGYQLKFPKQLELDIYATTGDLDAYIWKHISGLDIPVKCLQADQSNTFFPKTAEALKRGDNVTVSVIPDATHLFPFEQPTSIASELEIFKTQIN